MNKTVKVKAMFCEDMMIMKKKGNISTFLANGLFAFLKD